MVTEEKLIQLAQDIVDRYREAREHEWYPFEEHYGKELDAYRRFIKTLTGKSIKVSEWKVTLE